MYPSLPYWFEPKKYNSPDLDNNPVCEPLTDIKSIYSPLLGIFKGVGVFKY